MRISTQTQYLTGLYGEERALKILAEVGFDCVDFGLFDLGKYAGSPEAERNELLSTIVDHYKKVKKAAEKVGIGFGQLHAPFPSFINNPETDANMFALLEKSIEICAVLESPYIVIHPAIPKERIRDKYVAETKTLNMNMYGKLIPLLKKYNIVVGVENMFKGDPQTKLITPTVCSHAEEMCDYIDTLNEMAGQKCFAACLDVGHANLTGDTPENMISILGDRLEMLHVQDTVNNKDLHTAPFLGDINWEKTCNALKSNGYKGTFNFEADNFYKPFGEDLAADSARMLLAIGKKFVEKYEL